MSLNAGLKLDINKFKNILIDLFYHNIPNEAMYDLPISSLFKFNYDNKGKPYNLDTSKMDESNLELLHINYVKNNYNDYFGSFETYSTFKVLLKSYFNNYILYHYNGNLYND
jgi:hypothetical protein